MKDIDKILPDKRAWAKTARPDRRIKDGTPGERKDLSMVLKAGRIITRKTDAKAPWWIRLLRWIGLMSALLIAMPIHGHAQELTASWYSVESLKQEGTWAYSHGIMANGKEFKDEKLTCATRLWPLGATLLITNIKSHKRVTVRVTDKIGKRFSTKRIDLSIGAFRSIANIKKGLIKVKIERIK
jgi:hypothetical protein